MRRRLFLALGALPGLSGCGFALRDAPKFAFHSIHVNAAESSPFGDELRRNLASAAAVELLTDARLQPGADVVLDLLNEVREKTVVGVNTTGQVREFQIRLRITFRLRTPNGKELIAATELLQQRDISFNESAVLAKEAEEIKMYRDMQSDLVQQLMRRLAALPAL